MLSCTDQQCKWKKLSHERALKQYESVPLSAHECLARPTKKYRLDDQNIPALQAIMTKNHPNSALIRRKSGRHSPVVFSRVDKKEMTDQERQAINIIFQEQDCTYLMKQIQDCKTNELRKCCKEVLKSLEGDFIKICIDTKLFYDSWLRERKYRITGSTCYGLYTYTKNKNPNWSKKCINHIAPKDFRSEYTAYGKAMEAGAREIFKTVSKKHVIETGLIISKLNPWLAYSPDGVIFSNDKPSEVLEIKCPFKGKSASISEVVEEQIGKSLKRECGEIKLNRKHKYYGQVQLGMAVINVKKSAFVLYSNFDKNIYILQVEFDALFAMEMIMALKVMYFNIFLHHICLNCDNSKENVDENRNVT